VTLESQVDHCEVSGIQVANMQCTENFWPHSVGNFPFLAEHVVIKNW
jgi:hypothetical protein